MRTKDDMGPNSKVGKKVHGIDLFNIVLTATFEEKLEYDTTRAEYLRLKGHPMKQYEMVMEAMKTAIETMRNK